MAVATKLKEGWRIRSMSSERGRTMVLQEPVTSLVVGSSKKYSVSCRQAELGPCLGQKKINVQLGSGLVPTVWIVPVYIKAALPQYC